MDTVVYVTRDDILSIVTLLFAAPGRGFQYVTATATALDGANEEPASIERAAVAAANYAAASDFDVDDYPELFKDGEGAVEAVDLEADARIAAQIVQALRERFSLR
jgi:hypothetical protein